MSEEIVCPYCRMPFTEDGPPKIYCTACGMPHHEDCYQENGGCTVFGCARAPADDPKLQVSYSDLQMTPVAPVVQTTPSPQLSSPTSYVSSPYAGPLGLAAAIASAPEQQAAPPPSNNGSHAQPPATNSQPAVVQAASRQPKSRTTYILLGIFLGGFGAHNFYAGYTGRAVGQLCLTVLTLFYLAVASWIWAIVEICIVDKDSAGIEFS